MCFISDKEMKVYKYVVGDFNDSFTKTGIIQYWFDVFWVLT